MQDMQNDLVNWPVATWPCNPVLKKC